LGYQEIPRVFNGMGIAILSTPQGVVDGETAKNLKVGGELLCTVW
jgi:small subunit ribosomal protein S8